MSRVPDGLSKVERLASALDQALCTGVPIAQWTGAAAITLQEAYAVQALGMAQRCRRGDRKIGLKLAFTNRKAMAHLGVDAPVYGVLFAAMQVPDGGQLALQGLIRPRAEPEIAFLLSRRLDGAASLDQALRAVQAVAAAVEIIDSRYRDFHFSSADVVADNASACAFVLGPWQPPSMELGALTVEVELDGKLVAQGSSASILDHPLQALMAAARLASDAGHPLEAGTIVLTGSATDPVVLSAGSHMVVHFAQLGSVGFSVGTD